MNTVLQCFEDFGTVERISKLGFDLHEFAARKQAGMGALVRIVAGNSSWNRRQKGFGLQKTPVSLCARRRNSARCCNRGWRSSQRRVGAADEVWAVGGERAWPGSLPVCHRLSRSKPGKILFVGAVLDVLDRVESAFWNHWQ